MRTLQPRPQEEGYFGNWAGPPQSQARGEPARPLREFPASVITSKGARITKPDSGTGSRVARAEDEGIPDERRGAEGAAARPPPPRDGVATRTGAEGILPELDAVTPNPRTTEFVQRRRETPIVPSIQEHDVYQVVEKEQDHHLFRALRPTVLSANELKVSTESLRRHIKDTIQHRNECKMIPFIIAYFVAFAVMLMNHENIQDLSQVERFFKGMMEGSSFEGYNTPMGLSVSGHKVLEDIDTVTDIYTYLEEAFLPMFFNELNENDTAAENARVLRYNRVIGGVLMEQIRYREVPCAGEYPDLGPFNEAERNPFLTNFSCYPTGRPTTDCFGPGSAVEGFCANANQDPTTPQIVRRRLSRAAIAAKKRLATGGSDAHRVDPSSLYEVRLETYRGLDIALQSLAKLRQLNWIDIQTAWLGLRFLVLNPDLGVFTSMVVNVFLTPSGELVTQVEANTFLASPYQQRWLIALDCVWGVLWIHLSISCLVSLVKALRRKQLKEHCFDLFVLIEWGSCVGGIGVFVLWYLYTSSLAELREAVAHRGHIENLEGTAQAVSLQAKRSQYLTLFEKVSNFDEASQIFRVYVGWYTIGVMLRFFKMFNSQPRLSIVSRSLLACATDTLHFLIVFTVQMFAFAVSGMFLFGHRLITWSNLSFALQSVCQITIGNFDLDELTDEYPEAASLWFYSFQTLLSLIMLNMFLAIVMDTYTSVHSQSGSLDSIWRQSEGMLQDFRRRKMTLSPEVLLNGVKSISREFVGHKALCGEIPDLHEDQAKELIAKVYQLEREEDDRALSISDALRLMVSVKRSIKIMTVQMSYILNKRQRKQNLRTYNKHIAKLAGKSWHIGMPTPQVKLDGRSEKQVAALEGRVKHLEGFLNEMMDYMEYRYNEVRDRFQVIEAACSGQQDEHRTEGRTGPGGADSRPLQMISESS